MLAALNLKLLPEPLIPIGGGAIDLTPFLIMVGLLSLGSYFMLRRGHQPAVQLALQVGAAPLLVAGYYLAATKVRQLVASDPLLPTGPIELVPLVVGVGLTWLILSRRGPFRQKARRIIQNVAMLAFVFGVYPCACMVRDFLSGVTMLNFDNLTAFKYMMLIVPVSVFAMMWGRVFCGWVCPIGFVQEITTKLTNWMRSNQDQARMRKIRFYVAVLLLVATVLMYKVIKPFNEPILQGMAAGYMSVLAILVMLSVSDDRWERRLRIVRYVALSFFVGATVLGIYLHAAFCVLFTNILDKATILLFIGVLGFSLILSQAWCRFLCPEGALLGLLTRLSGFKINLDRLKCSGCNVCNTVCPVEAINLGKVDEKSCLYCCKCVDACPTDAIDMTQPPSDSLLRLPVLRATGS